MEGFDHFQIADYIVLAVIILISTGIGIYYGLCKSQKSTEEYLLGDRKMHPVPVALSLMVVGQSAVSVLGVPTEVYIYNIMILYSFVAIVLTNIFQAFVLVPLLHPLKLTSTYEVCILSVKINKISANVFIIHMCENIIYLCMSCKFI